MSKNAFLYQRHPAVAACTAIVLTVIKATKAINRINRFAVVAMRGRVSQRAASVRDCGVSLTPLLKVDNLFILFYFIFVF